MRVRKCEEHLDCTITLKGKNVVEHSRTHEKGLPMPEEPVGVDQAVISALADLLSTVANLGARLKALEPQVRQMMSTAVANKTQLDQRLGKVASEANVLAQRTENLALTLGASRVDTEALTTAVMQLERRHEALLGEIATTRAEFKQTRGEVEAVRNEVSRALKAAIKADDQFVKFGRMRDDLDKLIADQVHERTERLEATRRFQRSMKDVAHQIAES